jgi:hypothetical protein
VDSEEVESIVQRTNEKLAAETLKRQRELEARIAQLESKAAWSEVGVAPGSAAKAKTQELHGPHRGLASEFDSVATAPVQDAEIRPQPDTVHGADHSVAQDLAQGKAVGEQEEAETCQAPAEAHEGGLPTENAAADGSSSGQDSGEQPPGVGNVQDSQSESQSQVLSFKSPRACRCSPAAPGCTPLRRGQTVFAGLQGARCECVSKVPTTGPRWAAGLCAAAWPPSPVRPHTLFDILCPPLYTE